MKKFAALLLVLVISLGIFAAAEGDEFTPASPEESAMPETTEQPSGEPTENPSEAPSAEPSVEPTVEPSPEPTETVIAPDEYVVRVGLFYGSTALESANLQNAVGAGYLFGWFDSDDAFHAIAETSETQITMSASGKSSTGYVVTNTNTGAVIYEFDNGGASFGVLPVGADEPVTWHKGYKWSGGFEYRRGSNGRLTVINVVEIGDYTKGVIPYEIGTNWTEEGTKVGAICASSFAVYNSSRHRANGFDVCNTDHCQVYQGQNRATEFTNACCEAVADEALFYNGKICNAVYHSTNGGWTEDAKNVWGSEVPYLRAVEDTFEDLDRALHGRWSFTYTGEEIAWILTEKGYPIGTVTKAWVDLTAAGNVYRVNFEDAAGNKQNFEQERARSILGSNTLGKYTYSQRYTVTKGGELNIAVGANGDEVSTVGVQVVGGDGKVTTLKNSNEVYVLTASGTDVLTADEGDNGTFVVSGTGWGHNVGLSQWGSRGRAEAGWDYRSILEYYYTGAKVQKISEVMG